LEALVTGKLRPLNYRTVEGASSLLGQLENAQYLQAKALVGACYTMIEKIAKVDECVKVLVKLDKFCPDVVPADCVVQILKLKTTTALNKLRVRASTIRIACSGDGAQGDTAFPTTP
jgi:transcription elongation GreA/GreB family factor